MTGKSQLKSLPNNILKHIFSSVLLTLFLFLQISNLKASGKQEKVIIYTVNDGLPRNIVTCFAQDSFGYGWVGTKNGLARFDGYDFITYDSLSGLYINSILIDKNNDVWVGTHNGLYKYNRLTDDFLFVRKGFTQKLSYYNDTIFFMTGNKLWKIDNGKPVITGLSLIKSYAVAKDRIWYNPKNGEKGLLNTKSKGILLRGYKLDLIKVIDSTVFVASANGQLFVVKNDSTIENIKVNNHTSVKDIEPYKDQIWIATDGNGIIVLDKDFNFIYHHIKSPGKSCLLPSNSIYDIYSNGKNMLWLSTYGAGLACIIENKIPFTNIIPIPTNKNSLIAEEGSAIYCDDYKYLLGTNYGLSIWNTKTNKFHNFSFEKFYKELKGSKIKIILKNNKDHYIIGTYDGLLGEYTTGFKLIKTFKPIEANKNGMQKLVSGFKLKKNTFLFASLNQEVSFVRSNLSKNINEPVEFPDNLNIHQVMSIRYNKLGQIVVLINRFGLYQYLPKENKLYDLVPEINKHLNFVLNDFYQDKKGNYWIATRNKGLLKYSSTGKLLKKWDRKNGLLTNSLLRIETIDDNFIWVSSIAGLIRININSGHYQIFNSVHGLSCNEFSPRTSAITSDNKIIFGCTKGFVIVEPDKIAVDTNKTKVIISDILFQNKSIKHLTGEINLTEPLEKTKKIVLPFNRNSFTIKFFTKHDNLPKYRNFVYRLKDLEKNWIFLRNTNQTTYTNLPPGTYTFQVKNINQSNSEQDLITNLTITIMPPWYKTWWAYISYILLIVLLFVIIIRFYKKRLKLRMELDLAKYKAKHEHEITEKKITFFANIAHDLKTIATLIASPVSELLEMESTDESKKKKLKTIKVNAERLYKLNTDLLEFRKISQNQLPLKVSKVNLKQSVSAIFDSFFQECEKKNINYKLNYNLTEEVFADQKKVEKILWNLISNAVKYTGEKGNITVTVNSTYHNNCKALEIIVEDTGKGIDKKHLSDIFNRFYQIETGNASLFGGVGIGLFIVKELTQLHHGEISVNSEINKGSTFKVLIPAEEKCFNKDEIRIFSDKISETKTSFDNPKIESKETDKQKTKKKYNRQTIIIVEDNNDLGNYLLDHFSQENTVFLAKNGKEGLEIIKKENPDIIISDVKMPVMNGYQLCNEVKNNFATSHIPFILLTGNTATDDKIKGMYAGADFYISKPFQIKYLDAVVQSLLTNRYKLREKFFGIEPVEDNADEMFKHEVEFANELKLFILKNIENPNLNIEMLVKHFAISRSQLNKKIKSITGLTPNIYIKTLRLKKAYEMLQRKEGRVSEVAYSVGFSDPNYFTHCFKKEFGKNPSQI